MLDNPFAFMLAFTITTMCASALLYMVTGKEVYSKTFNVATFVFLGWIGLAMCILMSAASQGS